MIRKFAAIAKYIVSGGSAAAVNIGVLYLLTEFGHVYYLVSSVLSFVVAFFVSFALQKFWTFNERSREDLHWQMVGFLFVSLLNLVCNTALIALFVEWLHIWYLLAAVFAGAILAVVTFFIYRHIIFIAGENSPVRRTIRFLQDKKITLLSIAAFLLCAFFATYRLTESPPTWLDEGIITQVAINIAQHGPKAVIMIEPGTYLSAGYVTTSYPATYPVAVALRLFGIGLLQVRSVMALFILLCAGAAYALARKEMASSLALSSLFLLVTFAPLYGNGKNLLGEVPGLVYLFLFLAMMHRIEARESHWRTYAVAAVLLGLTVATKPIFLLILPPVAIAYSRSWRSLNVSQVSAAFLGFAAPMLLWVFVQFGGETLAQVLAVYANPHSNSFAVSFMHNARSFITQSEPFYALLLMGAWSLAVGVRYKRGYHLSRSEWIAWGFAALVYAAYLRGASYYRYFFLGEVLALIYLPLALTSLSANRYWRYVTFGIMGVLVVFQTYLTCFHSWVAEHYDSHRSAALAQLSSLEDKTVLVYQAPEAVVFLPQSAQYYQYLDITDVVVYGRENIDRVKSGQFDAVVMPQELESQLNLSHYAQSQTLDHYAVLLRK